MSPKCSNCGALLSPPAFRGAPLACHFCGARQILQPQAPPHLRGIPAPAPGVPRGLGVLYAIAGVVLLICVIAALARRNAIGPGAAVVPRLDVALLRNVSLAVTPPAMAAAMHVPAGTGTDMVVPLSGSPFQSVSFQWNEADLSHASGFGLSFGTPAPDVAAIVQRLRSVLGPRMNTSGDFSWGSASAGLSKDELSASVQMEGPLHGKNPHWKQQLDTLWDLVRAEALGMNVPVDDTTVRDWLGRGRPLSLLASLDPETDVDGSTAAVQRLFPGLSSDQMGRVQHRVALDHPLFSEATMAWDIGGRTRLQSVSFSAPSQAEAAAEQATFEACLESAYGPPTKRRVDPDYLNHANDKHAAEWVFRENGSVDVDRVDVAVRLETFSFSRPGSPAPGWHRMPRDSWQKVVGVLDACGKK